MKLKFQQGGTFVPPYAVFQPFIIPTQNNVSNSKTSSNKDDGNKMEKYYKLLDKLKGLPGDISAVSSKLVSLFDNIEYKLNSDGLFGDTSSVSSEYMMITNLISNIQTQYDAYQKAVDTAISKGSLNEVVIDSMGKIMVQSEEGFDWITPEEYFNNKDSYLPVTNSKLLEYRKDGIGGLAFNSESILAVTSGIGIAEVTKIIQDAIQDLGNTSNVNTNYIGVKSGDLLKGIQDYSIALQQSGKYDSTVQDLYKVKLLTEDQAKQAKLALQFIYNTLPESAKTLLKMKSNGTNSGVEVLIGTLINSKLTNKSEFIPDLVGGPSKEKSGKTESNNQKTNIEDSFLWRVQQNLGTHYGTIKINKESDQALTLKGTIFEQIFTPDNNHIGDDSVANMLNNSHLRSITIGKAYFGNQIISEEDMKKIMYKGDGLMRTNLPIDDSGKPVFELLELWESFKLDQELVKTPAKELIKQDKYKKLRSYFNNDGSWNKNKVKPFIIFNGMTTNRLINIEPKNKFVVDKDTSADMVGRIKLGLATKIGSDVIYSEIDEQNWYEPFSIQYDHIYEGAVFVPIHMNKNSSILNQNVDLGITYDIEEEYQNSLKPDYQATNINMLK